MTKEERENKETDDCPAKKGEGHHVARVCLDCHISFE